MNKLCGNDNHCGKAIPLDKITRLEVITKKGRELVLLDKKIELSFQDDFRTLKIFVK